MKKCTKLLVSILFILCLCNFIVFLGGGTLVNTVYATSTCAHQYSWVTHTEPTCTTNGISLYKCSLCGNISSSKSLPITHDYSIKKGKYFFNSTQHFERYICSICGAVQARNYQNHIVSEGRCVYGCGFVEDVTKCAMNNMLSTHESFIVIKYEQNSEGHLEVKYCTKCDMNVRKDQRNDNYNTKLEAQYDEKQHWDIVACVCGKSREENKGYHNGDKCTVCGYQKQTEAQKTLYGDANEDGIVDGRDCIRILKYSKNYSDATMTKQGMINADVNLDGKVNPADCQILMAVLAGWEINLPAKGMVMYGDLNEDGYLNETDISMMEKYVTGANSLGTQAKKNADFNGDGKINNIDIALIKMYYEARKDTDIYPLIEKSDMYGDINEDGLIDLRDSVLLARYLKDNNVQISRQGKENADISADLNIDQKDLAILDFVLTEIEIEEEPEIEQCTHEYQWYVEKEPTCTTEGSKSYICKKCQNVSKKETIKVIAHNYEKATCTKLQTCKVCGATTGSKLGHDYEKATCTKPQTCKVCGATTGNQLNHNYSQKIEGYSYNEKEHWEIWKCVCGKTQEKNKGRHNGNTCTVCGYVKPKELCEHIYEWEVILEPTCTETGTRNYRCKDCKDISKREIINPLGHDNNKATCTTPQTCNRCKQKTGDVKEHEYNTKVGGYFYDGNEHYEQFKCVCGLTAFKNRENHNIGPDGKCKDGCGYQIVRKECSLNNLLPEHSNGIEIIREEKAEYHLEITTCKVCGVKVKEDKVKHSYESKIEEKYDDKHHWSIGKCICGATAEIDKEEHKITENSICKCGYSMICKHEETKNEFIYKDTQIHIEKVTCKKCNIVIKDEETQHALNVRSVKQIDSEKHQKGVTCNLCGKAFTIKEPHVFDTKGECECGEIKKTETPQEPDRPKFEDIDEDAWYREDVENAVEDGLFNGTGDNTFSPNKPITRGMFVTVLARMESDQIEEFENVFDDVKKDAYYTRSINWAVANGIVTGFGDGKFGPDKEITREAMALILYNYVNKFHKEVAKDTSKTIPFADQHEVADWAQDAVLMLKEMEIIKGKSDGNYKPKGIVTRAEGAVILYRLSKMIKSTSKYYKPEDFGQNKPVMNSSSYSDADWSNMEKELSKRVQEAGYGTRAGVVEAALYMASLDYALPYRGKPQLRKADIGTYNKVGLNKTWGDRVKLPEATGGYEKGYAKTNGLDCGEFVLWAFINGGVLPSGSLDAGVGTNMYTNDLGNLPADMKSNLSSYRSRAHVLKNVADEVEPGDIILSYNTRDGKKTWTHVGLIVGVDSENVYVAEENTTTYDPTTDGYITVNKLVITRVPKNHSKDVLGYVVLCDDMIYKAKNEDGTENKGNIPVIWKD